MYFYTYSPGDFARVMLCVAVTPNKFRKMRTYNVRAREIELNKNLKHSCLGNTQFYKPLANQKNDT